MGWGLMGFWREGLMDGRGICRDDPMQWLLVQTNRPDGGRWALELVGGGWWWKVKKEKQKVDQSNAKALEMWVR